MGQEFQRSICHPCMVYWAVHKVRTQHGGGGCPKMRAIACRGERGLLPYECACKSRQKRLKISPEMKNFQRELTRKKKTMDVLSKAVTFILGSHCVLLSMWGHMPNTIDWTPWTQEI